MPATLPPGRELRAILAGRGFRRLLAARLTSQVADGWFQAGLAGSLLFNPERQASALAVATGFAILLLPYSTLGPFVGVFLDRWQRRTSLYVANLSRAGLAVPAALLLHEGKENLVFALFALLVIAANRFYLAGLGAALPHVVADQRLVTANAVATTLGTVAYATGLGSAAAVLGSPPLPINHDGYALIVLCGAAGYATSALLLRTLFTRTALGPADSQQSTVALRRALVDVARGMVHGLRHLVRRRPAGYAVLAQAGHRALYGVLTLATLLLFSKYLANGDDGRSISGLGLVVASGGVGALVAAFITPIATRRLPGWAWISTLFGAAAVALIGLAPSFRVLLLLIVTFLMNVTSQGTKIVVDTTLQHECDDAYRGRVFSVNDTAFNATFVGGMFTGAVLLPPDGRSVVAVIAVAIGYAVLAVWYAMAGRAAAQPRKGAAIQSSHPITTQ